MGEPYDPGLRSQQIAACAGTLGIFHRAVGDAEIGGKQWPDDPFAYAMMFVDQAEERVPEHRLSRASKQHVLELLKEMRELLETAKQRSVKLGWFDLALTTTEGTVAYSYDAGNRLTNAGGVAYTHDGRGNLTQDGTFGPT